MKTSLWIGTSLCIGIGLTSVMLLCGGCQTTPQQAAPAAQGQPGPPGQAGAQGQPGGDSGAVSRPCQPGDNAPAGTVNGGYRKVIVRTPVGNGCTWEKVQ